MADTPDTVEIELQEAIHLSTQEAIPVPRIELCATQRYNSAHSVPSPSGGPSGVTTALDVSYDYVTPVVTIPVGTVLKVKLRSQFFETDEGNEGVA